MKRQTYYSIIICSIFTLVLLGFSSVGVTGDKYDKHGDKYDKHGDRYDKHGDRYDGAPSFEVDPLWPKTLPNHWQIGQVPGIAVDKDDNIWIVHRPRSFTSDEAGATDALPDTDPPVDALGNPRPAGPIADCCYPAPSVLQFDKKGNLLRAWGGPDLGFEDPAWNWPANTCFEPDCEWPNSEHGIYVDHKMNVWLGGQAGRSVLKFAADGTFLLEIGARTPPVPGGDSNETGGGKNGTPLLGQPADMEVDPGPNTPSGRDELYIADGYTNHRVIVVDAETGMYLRRWGAYGANPIDDAAAVAMGSPTDPATGTDPEFYAPPYFRNPVHAVRITKDDLVYVADRVNNRIQVFDKWTVGNACTATGTPPDCGFLGEFFVERDTLGPGSTWDIEVSPDKRQKLLYNADGSNQHVWTLRRADGSILGNFGRNGRSAGQFHWVHNLAGDSKGNLYTAEVDTGKRVQKFNCTGRGCK